MEGEKTGNGKLWKMAKIQIWNMKGYEGGDQWLKI